MKCVLPAAIVMGWIAGSVAINAEPPVRPPGPPAATELPARQLGAEDLISVYVYDAPELSHPIRVGEDGNIRLSMLSKPIKASGLFPGELEKEVAKSLREGNVLIDPLVSISVMEYQSHPISVSGSVKAPLTFQAYGHVTLLDALARASGVTDSAGPDILISRRSATPGEGNRALVQRIPLKAVLAGDYPDIALQGGEEIRIPEAQKIYVVGNVKKPGAFAVRDGTALSVLKILALSEGLIPYAQKRAYIYRGDAGAEARQEVPIELSRIMQRKSPDVPLEPNDVLYIPEDATRHNWAVAFDKLLTIGGSGLGSALIYNATR